VIALFHRTDDGYLLRFPGRADFVLAGASLDVSCSPVPGVSAQLVYDLYHNQVVPLLRNRAGGLVLHASAVATSAGLLGFVGMSGQGKSTLAAALARAGHPFLTDDGLVLERRSGCYVAIPERPYLRLWSDSADAIMERMTPPEQCSQIEKSLVDAGDAVPHQAEPVPVAQLYLLGPGASEAVTIEPLAPATALSQLMGFSFVLDVDDRPRLRAHFDRLAAFADTVPCFALDYPRRYERLPEVVEEILAHALKERLPG